MVPPAISVIYCHLRWRDGSLWHWPLTHPTFFREWRIIIIVTPLSAARICLRDGDRRTKELQTFEGQLHRVLSPPRGGISLCSSSRSQELTVGDFLFSASLCFISHVPTKTDSTCGRGNLSCIPSAFGNMVHLTLRAFIAGLIEFWSLFISQHIKQTNSKYKYAPFIVSLWFISHGYDLCSVLVLRCNKT